MRHAIYYVPISFITPEDVIDKLSIYFHAITEGNIQQVISQLAEDPGLVNARNEQGLSAIIVSIYYNEPGITRLLLEAGAQLDIFDACATGDEKIVVEFIVQQPELVNSVAPDGFQPLGLACFFGHLPVVKILIEHGAEVNSASRNAQKVMPLHSAVAGRHIEIARVLLQHGADPNARQAGGYTPLHGAYQNRQAEMVSLLVDYGALLDVVNDSGKTPLELVGDDSL